MKRIQFGGKPVNLAPFAVGIMLAAAVVSAGGCASGLEDGYKFRPLSSSPEVRKSYYASPFTDEAEAGQKAGTSGPTLGTSDTPNRH